MAKLKSQTVHFWAECPWCADNAHNKVFPVTSTIHFDVDWRGRDVSFRFETDTQGIRNHVAQLHPDKIEVESGVCT
jgi:hypothetical protein